MPLSGPFLLCLLLIKRLPTVFSALFMSRRCYFICFVTLSTYLAFFTSGDEVCPGQVAVYFLGL